MFRIVLFALISFEGSCIAQVISDFYQSIFEVFSKFFFLFVLNFVLLKHIRECRAEPPHVSVSKQLFSFWLCSMIGIALAELLSFKID